MNHPLLSRPKDCEQGIWGNDFWRVPIGASLRISLLPNPTSTPKLPTRVIFNDPATIAFWPDGTKTIVKCSKDDTFLPEIGFLHAYFEKYSGMSKTAISKYLKGLAETDKE